MIPIIRIMKKLVVFLVSLFINCSVFGLEQFGVVGLESSFQTETVTMNDSLSVFAMAPSIGAYFSGSFFDNNSNIGFFFSDAFRVNLVSGGVYISNRINLGAAIRPPKDLLIASFASGIVLQPELQKVNNKNYFNFLLGLGTDFQVGYIKSNLGGYGISLNISSYPLLFSNSIDSKTKITQYGRLSVGVSIGASQYTER